MCTSLTETLLEGVVHVHVFNDEQGFGIHELKSSISFILKIYSTIKLLDLHVYYHFIKLTTKIQP